MKWQCFLIFKATLWACVYFFLLPIIHSIRPPSLKGRSETEHKETSLESSLCLNISHFDKTMKLWLYGCDEDWRRWWADLDCLLNGKNNAGDSGKRELWSNNKGKSEITHSLKKEVMLNPNYWTQIPYWEGLENDTFLCFYSWKRLFKHCPFPVQAQQLPDDFLEAVGAVTMATLRLERPPQDVLAVRAQVFHLQLRSQYLLCEPRLV